MCVLLDWKINFHGRIFGLHILTKISKLVHVPFPCFTMQVPESDQACLMILR